MSNTPPNLGNIIPNGRARKVVYGGYAAAALVVGGAVAYFLGTGEPIPQPLVGAQGVVAYVGLAVAGLAIANTPTTSP